MTLDGIQELSGSSGAKKNIFLASIERAADGLAAVPTTLSRLSQTWQKGNHLAFTKILVVCLNVGFKVNIKSGANCNVFCLFFDVDYNSSVNYERISFGNDNISAVRIASYR